MGTWDTGPMDNDTALDILGTITFDPSRSRAVLMVRLMEMTLPSLTSRVSTRGVEIAEDMQAALASCAIIADAVRKDYFYTNPPLQPGDDLYDEDNKDFCLEMVDLDDELESEARKALTIYRDLEENYIDLGWKTKIAYLEHRSELTYLEKRLDRNRSLGP